MTAESNERTHKTKNSCREQTMLPKSGEAGHAMTRVYTVYHSSSKMIIKTPRKGHRDGSQLFQDSF